MERLPAGYLAFALMTALALGAWAAMLSFRYGWAGTVLYPLGDMLLGFGLGAVVFAVLVAARRTWARYST